MFGRRNILNTIIFVVVVIGLLVGIVVSFWWRQENILSDENAVENQVAQSRSQNRISNMFTAVQEFSQPQPFAELTIPYLRQQTYQSQLSALEQVARNSNYTSYITNYDSEDLQINGLLTVPNGEVPETGWPAIVFIHGYIPPTQYRTRERYVAYVDYLARNGFVVFKIDLRGHDQSEGEATGAYYSSGYVIDTLNAVSALAGSDFVNSDAIGLWGHSMAGNVVARSMAVQPTISAGVIWGGAVYSYEDFQEYGISDSSYRRPSDDSPRRQSRDTLFNTHGSFQPNSAFWRDVAPTNFLDDFQGAIQLHHAQNDSTVSIEYSRNFANLLEATGVPHELYEYSSGGHDIEGSSFNQAMARTVEFFEEYLGSE